MEFADIEKRKPGRVGRPRKAGDLTESAVRMRRMRNREQIEKTTAHVMAEVVGDRVRALMPKDVPQEIINLTVEASEESSRLISEKGPTLVANLLRMAENGDMAAYQMLAKNILPTPSTRVRLPKDQSLNELTDSVINEVAEGRMPIEVGEKVLGLVSKAADVAVSGSLVARLNKLNEQLQVARERQQLPGTVENLSRRIVSIEALPE